MVFFFYLQQQCPPPTVRPREVTFRCRTSGRLLRTLRLMKLQAKNYERNPFPGRKLVLIRYVTVLVLKRSGGSRKLLLMYAICACRYIMVQPFNLTKRASWMQVVFCPSLDFSRALDFMRSTSSDRACDLPKNAPARQRNENFEKM